MLKHHHKKNYYIQLRLSHPVSEPDFYISSSDTKYRHPTKGKFKIEALFREGPCSLLPSHFYSLLPAPFSFFWFLIQSILPLVTPISEIALWRDLDLVLVWPVRPCYWQKLCFLLSNYNFHAPCSLYYFDVCYLLPERAFSLLPDYPYST